MKTDVFVGDSVLDIHGNIATVVLRDHNGTPTLSTRQPPMVLYCTPAEPTLGFTPVSCVAIKPGMSLYENGEFWGVIKDPNAPVPPKTFGQRLQSRLADVRYRISNSQEEIIALVFGLIAIAAFKFEYYFLACFLSYICGIMHEVPEHYDDSEYE